MRDTITPCIHRTEIMLNTVRRRDVEKEGEEEGQFVSHIFEYVHANYCQINNKPGFFRLVVTLALQSQIT